MVGGAAKPIPTLAHLLIYAFSLFSNVSGIHLCLRLFLQLQKSSLQKKFFLGLLHFPSSAIRMWSEPHHKRKVIANEKEGRGQIWGRNHRGRKTEKDISLLNKYLWKVSANYLLKIFIHVLCLSSFSCHSLFKPWKVHMSGKCWCTCKFTLLNLPLCAKNKIWKFISIPH